MSIHKASSLPVSIKREKNTQSADTAGPESNHSHTDFGINCNRIVQMGRIHLLIIRLMEKCGFLVIKSGTRFANPHRSSLFFFLFFFYVGTVTSGLSSDEKNIVAHSMKLQQRSDLMLHSFSRSVTAHKPESRQRWLTHFLSQTHTDMLQRKRWMMGQRLIDTPLPKYN